MVQDVVYAAYGWVLGLFNWIVKLLPTVLIGVGVLGLLWLALKKVDPERADRWAKASPLTGPKFLRLVGLTFITTVLCGLLIQGEKVTTVRQATILESAASRRNEPTLSGVVQFSPSVAVVEEKTYTRRLVLPPDFLRRIGEDGVQVLSPYLQDPSTENVLKLVDNFKRSGTDVVFTRELTRLDETSISADVANVNLDLQSQSSSSGRRHFIANFEATFKFKNPRDREETMRFVFPLPEGSGTIEGFSLETGGQRISDPDDKGVYAWQGKVPAGGEVQVIARYKFTGAGAFDYRLGSERRRIGDFNLTANTRNQVPKFGKSGIFPTSISGNQAEWHLKDVLTYQNIEIVLPRVDADGELLDKTLTFLPVVLVLFALGTLWCGSRAIAASVAFGLGLLAVPVLAAYAVPLVSVMAGALLATVGGGLVLSSKKGWMVAFLCGLLALAFLTVEHAGLVAWLVAAAAAGVLGRNAMVKAQPLEAG